MTNKPQKPVSFWRWDLIAGLASGFPLCCVLYYLFRMKYNHKEYGWCRHRSWLDKLFPQKFHTGFILCPIHRLLKKNFTWYKCQNGCRWQQLNCDECVGCKMRLRWNEARDPMREMNEDEV